MTRKHAFITTLVGTLLIFPVGALADHGPRSGGGRNHGGLDVRVKRGYSGPARTHVEVRKSSLDSGKTGRVQVIATPKENRPLDPLEISVNAQAAVVQVVLDTNNKAVLDRVNVSITQNPQGGTPTNGQPGAPVDPPASGDNPPASPSGGPINISVNAQVAIVQVVLGRNNTAILKNINVNITQGVGAEALATPSELS